MDASECKPAWHEEGIENGIEKGKEETAFAAPAKGVPPEIVQEMTGLDMAVIRGLEAAAEGKSGAAARGLFRARFPLNTPPIPHQYARCTQLICTAVGIESAQARS